VHVSNLTISWFIFSTSSKKNMASKWCVVLCGPWSYTIQCHTVLFCDGILPIIAYEKKIADEPD